jgi:hypothetical protein
MLHRFLLLAAFCGFALSAGAQEKTAADAPQVKKPSRDFVMLQFTYDNWANKPDSVNIGGFGRGFNAYLCYDFPIKSSHFSFAIGAGIGTSSIFFNNQQLVLTDSGQTAAKFINERQEYSKFKMLLAYAEAPLELRYFANKENRNRGFKMAVGARIGGLIQAHTKGNRTENGAKLTEKVQSRDFLEKVRLSGTVRIGFGNLSAFGAYNFNSVFKDGAGPQVTPYSIGICLTGL